MYEALLPHSTPHLYPKAATVTHSAREQKLAYSISFLARVNLDMVYCYVTVQILFSKRSKKSWNPS